MSTPTNDTTKNRNHLISFMQHEEALSVLTEISSRLDDDSEFGLTSDELDDLVRETFDIRKREEAEKLVAARRPSRPVEDEESW